MNSILNLACLVALLIPLCWKLHRDYFGGLAYAVFLSVSMSTFLRIPLPGVLPQLTIFRLILLLLLFAWLGERRRGRLSSEVPCSGFLWLWAIGNLIPVLLTTISFTTSLKRYLDFTVEICGFYWIVCASIRTREEAMRLLHAAVAGVGFVALLACIEKYTRFNPVSHIMTADAVDIQEGGMRLRDVVATYQHRILLGTGMAMGAPLAFVLAGQAVSTRQRRYFWILSILMVAACYFSQSRGPWLGAVMACGVLAYLGSARARKVLVRIAVLTLLVLVARPGVYTTLFNSAKVTTQSESFKGGTFKYRLELWKVAWDEVTKSPERFLFGYGPGCGLENTVQWNLSYRGTSMQIWSWDNQYAYDLYQSGFAGLLTRLALYFALARGIYRLYRRAEPADRDVLAGLFASAFVLIFMMSNVLIYAKPLHFLFGTIVAVGFSFALPKLPDAEDAAAGETLPEAAQPALTV